MIADVRLRLQVDFQHPVFGIPQIGADTVIGDVAVGVIEIRLGVGGDNLIEVVDREVGCR